MKKIFILTLGFLAFNISKAQDTTSTQASKKQQDKVSNSPFPKKTVVAHPSDHFMIQFGSDSWQNKPDSAHTKGGRHFNFYVMLDKPFKTNPKFSVAYGLGIGSSNIYFDKSIVDIKANSSKLPFNYDGAYRFNKFKITEIFLELPVELRYTLNPENANKSWKFAVGAKVGTLLKAYTKGKDLQDNKGVSIYGPTYIEKEFSKKYFNTTRLALTARVGYGNFSLSAGYTLTPAIKSGFTTTDINTLSVGLTISGL